MKKTLRTFLVAAAVAAGVLVAPAAAQASTIYPPSNACSVTPATTAPGGTAAFSCAAGTFSPNEPVTVTLTGEDAAGATLAFVRFEVNTKSTLVTSAADGSLPAVSITFSDAARGAYNVAASSATSSGGAGVVTVVSSGGGAGSLSVTGMDGNQLLGFWIGGGALVLAGGALVVAASVRHTRRRTAV